MTQKELKRLSRSDLLSMMLTLSKENDQLRKEVEQLRKQVEDKNIAISESGSLAEAALRLNGVFEAAQAACDQYTSTLKERSENIERYCADMEQKTKKKCEKMLADAQKRVDSYLIDEAMKLKDETEDFDWKSISI